MKNLPIILVLLLVGYASCTCRHETNTNFRSVEGCAMNRMYRPLCGTDGCNYINDNALKCAQDYDRSRNLSEEEVVREAYPGPCKIMKDGSNEVIVDDAPKVRDMN